ncbi:flagellin [Candidatus Haliotispira prima]|uniref:Flagellin n=1 Tax=Candidatus Haliotispira prima TaxID=3034016 RepID=A0ABY8MJK4_9SPIO|nr:flagellin [Candidatus Haliotispira prima]
MIINHNLSALNTSRVQGINDASATKGMERLSSGVRINHASDDAAGLAISEKMRAQISGLNQASRNIQDGVSFIQATEGHLNETTSILQRLRVLAVQSANGIYQQEDRSQIQVEVSQLVDEVTRIAEQAQFNGMNMLDGTFSGGVQAAVEAASGQAQPAAQASGGLIIHMGANADQRASISIGNMDAVTLGLDTVDLSSPDGANTALGQVDNALRIVNKQRADLGAYQNRMIEAQGGVDVASENLQAAESRIRDANMSARVVDFTRDQIKSQAAIAMLAQANQRPQQVLQLLR